MPLLNFQSRFAPLVESGEKRQTIRAYRKDGRDPKVGDRLYLYTGARTKACRKLGEARARLVREIRLSEAKGAGLYAWLNAQVLSLDETEELAMRDGFYGSEEMQDWFLETHGLPFRGLLIEWGEIDSEGRP